MKQTMSFAPTFVPASKTLNFSGYSGFVLNNLIAVINQTRRTVIYCPAQGTGFGYTSFSAGVLTLDFDTTTHSSGDILEVLYDVVGQKTKAESTSMTIASDQNSIPVDINFTVFQYSANGVNSSITQLTAGATFTGTIEAIPNQPDYSLLVYSDQNATITIREYIDGTSTYKVFEKVYTYLANSQFAVSAPANGNYFQVIAQNTGGSTTTLFNINTAYGIIRSSSQLNNQPSAINEINGSVVDANSGARSGGTQRICIATDDVNLAAINAKTPALGLAAPSASVPVALANDVIVGAAASTAALNVDLITGSVNGWYDASAYNSVGINIIGNAGITAGAISIEETNDITNASAGTLAFGKEYPIATNSSGAIISAQTISASTLRTFKYAVSLKYFRIRVSTAFTGGTVQAVCAFSQLPVADLITSAQIYSFAPNVPNSIMRLEDAAHSSGDGGVFCLGVRNDTLAASTSATGDYSQLTTDQFGTQITKDIRQHKQTYCAAFVVTPAATTPTDVFQLIGSATKTVEVTKIEISGTQTTAGLVNIYIAKRSTANTGGTSTATTNVPLASTNAAATAVGAIYTANPTTGTPVGNVQIRSVPINASTSTTDGTATFTFGQYGQPFTLIGVAQALAINLNSVATLTGGSLRINVEWVEY